jgi:transposase
METIEAIKSKYGKLSEGELLAVIARLLSENGYLKSLLYTGRSERRREEPTGIKPLFDEVEDEAGAPGSEPSEDDDALPVEESSEGDKPRKRRGKRKPLPDHLPRIRKMIDLSDEEKVCQQHKVELEMIGEEIVEKLVVEPARAYVTQIVSVKYKCPCCDAGIFEAAREPDPIPKSFASAGLLALIATQKYSDALPLFRQEHIFARAGIDLNRTTMARWMLKMGELAKPLLNLMHEDLLASPVLHMDETTVQVLGEPERPAETQSYMWCMARQGPEPIIYFQYYPTRSTAAALDLLQDYKGTLVCDGYKVYDSAGRKLQFTVAACMAHIRRKFWQAEKTAKKEAKKGTRIMASEALAYIKRLYAIEEKFKDQPPDIILSSRKEYSIPILDEFYNWLKRMETSMLPSSPTGKAVRYALEQWPKALVFASDGKVPMDNNYLESHIRPFVIGRNNWIFSQSTAGAHASAALYSLVETTKANGTDPFDYLSLIFKELPRSLTMEKLETLLPHKARHHHLLRPWPVNAQPDDQKTS